MSKFGEKLCYVLTWVTQGSNYLSAYGYGVMHRMHHAYADTEKDLIDGKFLLLQKGKKNYFIVKAI